MSKKELKNFLNRILLSIIIFFFLCLVIDNTWINPNYVLKNNIDFSYIRSKSKILFGMAVLRKDVYVTSEKIKYYSIEKYKNGYKLLVDNNYVIKNLKEGVVIFIGNIEKLGKTIKIESSDGVIISYSGLENISVNMYDYVETNSILGSTIENNLYLSFEKNKEYIGYEEYL